MKACLIIILVLISANVNSAVPHLFVSGSPAKASEVNNNFSALDQRTDELEAKQLLENNRISNIEILNSSNVDRISVIEESLSNLNEGRISCANNGDWWSNKHVITYNYKTSSVGESISLNGGIYRIIEIGFNEYSSGDYYKIKYPIKENNTSNVSGYITLGHSKDSVKCSDFNISGFPAYSNNVSEYRSISFINNGTTQSSSSLTFNYTASLKIEETILTIFMSAASTENGTVVPNGVFDFSSSLNGISVTHDIELLNVIDDLVDYIEIRKVQ